MEVTVETILPTISFEGDSIVSTAPSSVLEIDLSVDKGSFDLNSIKVDLDGTTIVDMTVLQLAGQDFATNPQALEGEDRNGFNKTLSVGTPDEVGTYLLTITIADVEGNEVSQNINMVNGTTPINFMGSVFFNRIGSESGDERIHFAGRRGCDPGTSARLFCR